MKKKAIPEFDMPEVSVILTIQNKSKNLFKIVDCLKNQTFSFWELIIVDNGSKDSPINFLLPFFEKGLPIRYIKQQPIPNKFVATNIGMRTALGKYITFIGEDDKYLPNHLQSRVDYFNEHPEIALIQGGFEVIGLTSTIDPENPEKTISIYDAVVGETFFGKKEFFRKHNGFDSTQAFPAYDLWKKAEAENVCEKINEPISYFLTRLL